VDSSVVGYQQIVAATKEGVTAIVFDRKTDTYASLLEKVAAAGVPMFKTAGIVQHGSSFSSSYSILDTEKPALLSEVLETPEPTMPSWTDLVSFFNTLKATYTVEIIDLISCSLLDNPLWVAALNQLEVRMGVNFRASADPTGNLVNGGNWVQESDNVNIQDVYFTDAIANYTNLLINTFEYRRSNQLVDTSNNVSYPMITKFNPVNEMITVATPCSIITWGADASGGNSSSVSAQLVNIVSIAATNSAFAAITDTGRVITWGDVNNGGNSSSVSAQLIDVVAIASTAYAFAALRRDGRVITWGADASGGSTAVPGPDVSGQLTNIVAIASTYYAFAALKHDLSGGTVVTWGDAMYGGSSSSVSGQLINIDAITSTAFAFAALRRTDKKVITWGASFGGGSTAFPGPDVSGQLINVSVIASTPFAFAALRTDKKVITWGASFGGGNSSDVSGQLINVDAIASNRESFAALTNTKTVILWGAPGNGGTNNTGVDLTNIRALASTYRAYAAIKTDASGAGVVLWGDASGGGFNNTSANISSNVQTIASSENAFSAIKTNGDAVAWGYTYYPNSIDTTAIQSQLVDVTEIIATRRAFSALKEDGSVISWGDDQYGGSQTIPASVVNQLKFGIINVASNRGAFAAFKLPVTNSFPLRVNPFVLLDTVLVYTQEAMDALAAGLPLPLTSLVNWAPHGMPAGSLLRDLNRSVVVPVSSTNPLHAYRFQRIQLIRGPTTEGAGGSYTDTDAWQTGYICVWAAGGVPPVYA
jgi:hypothetical protein